MRGIHAESPNGSSPRKASHTGPRGHSHLSPQNGGRGIRPSEWALMEDGESGRPRKGCGFQVGRGSEKAWPVSPHAPLAHGSCAQTYLICSVVKSVETQVPLGKCRRWTQAEEDRLAVCTGPPVQECWGWGDPLSLEQQAFAFKTPN